MQELKQNWRDIFRGFRLGLDIWKIGLAFVGLVASVVGIAILMELQEAGNWIPLAVAGVAVWLLLLVNTLRAEGRLNVKKLGALLVLLLLLGGLVWLFDDLPERAVTTGGAVVVLTLVWALFGGAITRSATVELATEERLGMWEALQYAWGRYRHYAWSILAPLVGIVFFLLIMALGGWVARCPVLDVLVSLTTLLYLLAGFIIMLILVGLVVGWPLMFPAISAEGSDSFDAISRAYSYIYTKPWKYIWYHLVALAYAGAIIFFVKLFALGMVGSVDRSLDFGMGGDYADSVRAGVLNYGMLVYEPVQEVSSKAIATIASHDVTGGVLTRFLAQTYGLPAIQVDTADISGTHHVVAFVAGIGFIFFILAVVSFAVSLGFSLQTIIYLLMRKDVDGTDVTEVFQEEEEEEDYLAGVGVPEEEAEEGEAEEAPPTEEAEEAAPPVEEAEEAPATDDAEEPKKEPRRRGTGRRPTTPEKEEEESE